MMALRVCEGFIAFPRDSFSHMSILKFNPCSRATMIDFKCDHKLMNHFAYVKNHAFDTECDRQA